MGRNKRRKHKNKKTVIGLSICGAAAVLLFGIFTAHLYQERLEAQAQAEAWKEQMGDNIQQSSKVEDSFGQAKDTVIYKGNTYKRKNYIKAYLFMGVDRSDPLTEPAVPGSGGQSDGIFLAAWDTSRNTVKILMIPRDTMTDIILTDLSGNEMGHDVQHLTLAYAYGDGLEKSCEYMARAVTNLCGGLKIDGYMSVSLGALPIVNDLVGGVEVTIEDEALTQRYDEFVLGDTVTLQGEEAERFLRYRDIGETQTAIGRMERHKAYLEGFSKAAKETARQEDGLAVKILDGIKPYMVTNMAKDEYLKIAADFLSSSQALEDSDFLTIPGEGVEAGMYDEYHADMDGTQEMILSLFYGLEIDE